MMGRWLSEAAGRLLGVSMWLYSAQKSSTVVTVMMGRWLSSQVRLLSFLKNQSVHAFCRGCFLIFSGAITSESNSSVFDDILICLLIEYLFRTDLLKCYTQAV